MSVNTMNSIPHSNLAHIRKAHIRKAPIQNPGHRNSQLRNLSVTWRFRMRNLAWTVCMVVSSLTIHCSTVQAASHDKPNVVFMLADDLGYGELGCYGQAKIKTPNLDRLAAQGMRFTQHYTGAPVCAPARCTLLTGQNLAHAEIRGNRDSGNGRIFPGQWPISDGVVTIAEKLQDSGYTTGAFGKWGLGPSNTSGSPIKQGFDRFYGYNCQRNAHSYFPLFLDSDEKEVVINSGLIYGHQRKPAGDINADDYRLANYAPDMILNESLKFIDEHHQQPFFLYLPFVEPHVSMQPPQEWIDRYPDSWESEKGVYRGQNGYLPHPRPRAAYAAMISDLDEHVGKVLSKLEEHSLTNDTIVVFTSDNGTTHPGRAPDFHIGGVDADFFNSTAGLRDWKGSVYEGGIRVPCLVRWPGHVEPGSVTEFASYFPDWFPTLSSICGAATENQQPLDGVDLTSVLLGQSPIERHEPMIWEFHGYGGQLAIRIGHWKAVRRDLLKKQPTPWELYDLNEDRQERNDLAGNHPDVIEELEAAYLRTRIAEPDFPNRTYDAK
ncbi:Arylsulfatase [Rubripirellula amarantea]|uniref:Arylsulfatase n=1 Tax=Rubripirellula amarantea TaxID=2527999 RepID=A0A5C5WK47_9BACT|nr:arylsulfatase [Rubripirellula amarantea]TWT51156.1 Arylsulfatase [Rubripirellula amarantea]